MRVTLLLLSVLFHLVQSQLYALDQNNNIVRLDPETARSTVISTLSEDYIPAQELSAIDNRRGIFYLLLLASRSNRIELVGIQLPKGDIISKVFVPVVGTALVGVGQTIDVDDASGDVFVTGSGSAGQHLVFRITPSTGIVFAVGSLPESENVIGGLHAYDPINELLWLEYVANRTFNLYGLDVDTGDLKITIPNSLSMETMVYNPMDHLFWGFGVNVSVPSGLRTLVTLDPETGKFELRDNLPEFWIIVADLSALDYKKGVLYTMLSPQGSASAYDLVGVDIHTGKVLSKPSIPDDIWCLEFLNM